MHGFKVSTDDAVPGLTILVSSAVLLLVTSLRKHNNLIFRIKKIVKLKHSEKITGMFLPF